MDIMLASLISGKVIMWQIILGGVQLAGMGFGGRVGGAIAFILVVGWTVTQTYGSLMVLQLVVQGAIAFFLYSMED